MTLQELKESCVSRYNEVKTKAVSFMEEQRPKLARIKEQLLSATPVARTKRAAAKIYIDTDGDDIKISIEGKKKDIAKAIKELLGE